MAGKREDTRHQERPRVRLHVGDTVELISGKDRGGRGEITEVLSGEERVRVSGLAVVTKHQRAGRARAMARQAGKIQMPGKIHISNVMLVCPTCSKRNRPRYEGTGAHDKQRICRNCGAVIGRRTVEG